jgi:hypothetical protein
MPDTDLINRIVALTKCGVHIDINEHRNLYETVEQYLPRADDLDLDPDVRRTMIDTDTVVEVISYPNTPVGHHIVYHHDLTAALTEMLRILEGNTDA